MHPSEVSSLLKYIADEIDGSASPSRISISSDIRAIIYLLESGAPTTHFAFNFRDLFKRKPTPEQQHLIDLLEKYEKRIDLVDTTRKWLSDYTWVDDYGDMPDDVANFLVYLYSSNSPVSKSFPLSWGSPLQDIFRWNTFSKMKAGWKKWCDYVDSNHYFEGNKPIDKAFKREFSAILRTIDLYEEFVQDNMAAAEEMLKSQGVKLKKKKDTKDQKTKLKPFPGDEPEPTNKKPSGQDNKEKSELQERSKPDDSYDQKPSKKPRDDGDSESSKQFTKKQFAILNDFFNPDKNPPGAISSDNQTIRYVAEYVDDDFLRFMNDLRRPFKLKYIDGQRYYVFRVDDIRRLRVRFDMARQEMEWSKSYDKSGKYIGKRASKRRLTRRFITLRG
jgi:hypothetical protein